MIEMINLIISLIATTLFFRYGDKLGIRINWNRICKSDNKFTNNFEKTLKIIKVKRTDYGYIIKIELPYSYTIKDLETDLDKFKEGLKMSSIQITSKGNVVELYCIKKYTFKEYEPIKLPPNKLLIADGLTEPIVVDMNKFPHLLLGGDTGTGKSRILLLILTNLIKHNYFVDIHLLQIRKNDLGVFVNCKQVKSNAKTLQDVLNSLIKIDKECSRREGLIDNTKGYYNIEDYNKANPKDKLKYTYVVVEEFSFLNTSRGDTKQDKKLKLECLKYVKNIVNVGRSSGVFLITALQKPTDDSIPSDIKAQLTTRVSLKIKDSPSSVVILGNGKATSLQERQVLVSTLNEVTGYSYTINHNIIMDSVKNMVLRKSLIDTKLDIPTVETEFSDIMSALNEINN